MRIICLEHDPIDLMRLKYDILKSFKPESLAEEFARLRYRAEYGEKEMFVSFHRW